jgi:ABC-type multidrug transport system fused ATPase/permease subunit
MKGRTSVVIAHHLSTIRSADTIFVIREAAVSEAGSHEELVAAGGAYSELYRSETQNIGK